MSIYPIAYKVENNYLSSFINIHHHHVPLLTLCGKRVRQSQWPVRNRRFESNFLTLQGKPNAHTWAPDESPKQLSPFFPGPGSGPPSESTRAPRYGTVSGRDHSCTRHLHMGPKFEGWRVCPFPGPIGYLAFRLPYSRYAVSTFKCLTTTTTHCGLSIFCTKQTGSHPET